MDFVSYYLMSYQTTSSNNCISIEQGLKKAFGLLSSSSPSFVVCLQLGAFQQTWKRLATLQLKECY